MVTENTKKTVKRPRGRNSKRKVQKYEDDISSKFLIILSLNSRYIEFALNTILSVIRFHPNISFHINFMDINKRDMEKLKFRYIELSKNITFSSVYTKNIKTKEKKILGCLIDKPGWINVSKEKIKKGNEYKKDKITGYYSNYMSTIINDIIHKTDKNILYLDSGLLINKNLNYIFESILKNDIFIVNSHIFYIDNTIPNNEEGYHRIMKQCFPDDIFELDKINNYKMMSSLLGVKNNNNGKLFCRTFNILNDKFYKGDWFNDQILLNVCYNYYLQKSNMNFFLGSYKYFLNWDWDTSSKDAYILSGKGNRKFSEKYNSYIEQMWNDSSRAGACTDSWVCTMVQGWRQTGFVTDIYFGNKLSRASVNQTWNKDIADMF